MKQRFLGNFVFGKMRHKEQECCEPVYGNLASSPIWQLIHETAEKSLSGIGGVFPVCPDIA